jgi:hypothetical protein
LIQRYTSLSVRIKIELYDYKVLSQHFKYLEALLTGSTGFKEADELCLSEVVDTLQ